jgi:hypothetical protein
VVARGRAQGLPLCHLQGLLTLSKRLNDESKVDESNKDDSEFVKAGEDAAEPFEPLDLIALAVDGLIILPWFRAVALRWNYRDEHNIQSRQPRIAPSGPWAFLPMENTQETWLGLLAMLPPETEMALEVSASGHFVMSVLEEVGWRGSSQWRAAVTT